MVHDSTDNPDDARARKSPRRAAPDAPPEGLTPPDLDPATPRGDKSFPYVRIPVDQWAPQILKPRGAQPRPGRYFGPFPSAGAANRPTPPLQRAFLIRPCTDPSSESPSRPCLLYQIRRCAGP